MAIFAMLEPHNGAAMLAAHISFGKALDIDNSARYLKHWTVDGEQHPSLKATQEKARQNGTAVNHTNLDRILVGFYHFDLAVPPTELLHCTYVQATIMFVFIN